LRASPLLRDIKIKGLVRLFFCRVSLETNPRILFPFLCQNQPNGFFPQRRAEEAWFGPGRERGEQSPAAEEQLYTGGRAGDSTVFT